MSSNGETDAMLTVRGSSEELARITLMLCQVDNIELGEVNAASLEESRLTLDAVTVPGYYGFSEITTPDQWLGREHFLVFRKRFTPETDKKVITHVFGAVTQPRARDRRTGHHGNKNHRLFKEDSIEKLGLEISSREQVGFPTLSPYYYGGNTSNEENERVVRAGSLIKFSSLLERSPEIADQIYRFHNMESPNRLFLGALAAKLSEQIQG